MRRFRVERNWVWMAIGVGLKMDSDEIYGVRVAPAPPFHFLHRKRGLRVQVML